MTCAIMFLVAVAVTWAWGWWVSRADRTWAAACRDAQRRAAGPPAKRWGR